MTAVALLTQTTVTASGAGSVTTLLTPAAVVARLRVSGYAATTTPSGLTVTAETRSSSAEDWQTVETRTFDSNGVFDFAFEADLESRLTWALDGVSTATIACAGETVTTYYATLADLTSRGIAERAIAELSNTLRVLALVTASSVANGYLSAANLLPLTSWGDDIKMYVAKLAAGELLQNRGYDPQGPDKLITEGAAAARAWLLNVSNGRIIPDGIVDATPEVFEGGAYVKSRPSRGW